MPSLARSGEIAAQEVRLLVKEPVPLVAMLVMPLLFISFLNPFFDAYLGSLGLDVIDGTLLVLPAMAATFSFLLVESFGVRLYHDFEENTWRRALGGYATTAELIVGRTIRWLGHLLLQNVALFSIAVVVYGVRLDVRWPALMMAMLLTCICGLSFGAFAFAIAPNLAAFDALTFGVGLVLAGIGGAFTPPELLPGWLQSVEWISPIYWIIQMYRTVLLEGGGVSSSLREAGIVVGFTLGFTLVAALTFDPLTTRRAM